MISCVQLWKVFTTFLNLDAEIQFITEMLDADETEAFYGPLSFFHYGQEK